MHDTIHLPDDLTAALSEFDAQGMSILSPLLSRINEISPPQMIYHYTDERGLRGILETGNFWLTDIFGMNDPSELRHGLEQADKLLRKKLNGFEGLFDEFSRTGVSDTAHYFSLSFSLDGDDLNQWCRYADDGRGYAIGFEASSLEHAFSRLAPGQHFAFPVWYDESHLVELHQRLVEAFLTCLSALPPSKVLTGVGRNFLVNMLWSFTSVALHISILFKHGSSHTEHEYRFLQVFGNGPPTEIRSRPRRHSSVKYREFDWRSVAPSSLKLVRVGPAADKSKAKQLAHDCLRVFHTGSVEIDSSPIPYRA
jgi:hypothetical protein